VAVGGCGRLGIGGGGRLLYPPQKKREKDGVPFCCLPKEREVRSAMNLPTAGEGSQRFITLKKKKGKKVFALVDVRLTEGKRKRG